MTIDEFFDVVNDVPFYLTTDGKIRTKQKGSGGFTACPVSAACNILHGTQFDYHICEPGSILGLDEEDAQALAEAADNKYGEWNVNRWLRVHELRDRMEKELINS